MDWSIDSHGPTANQPIVGVCPHMIPVRIMQMVDQLRSQAHDEDWNRSEVRHYYLDMEWSISLDCSSSTLITVMCAGIKPDKALFLGTRLLVPLKQRPIRIGSLSLDLTWMQSKTSRQSNAGFHTDFHGVTYLLALTLGGR